jgi:hypothetical protein
LCRLGTKTLESDGFLSVKRFIGTVSPFKKCIPSGSDGYSSATETIAGCGHAERIT